MNYTVVGENDPRGCEVIALPPVKMSKRKVVTVTKSTKANVTKRRRKSSEKYIPKDISDWRVDTLDLLQIHYDMHAMKTPCDVLDTVNCVPSVQNEIQEVLRFIKRHVKFNVDQSELQNISLADVKTMVDERQELKECLHSLEIGQWKNIEKEM